MELRLVLVDGMVEPWLRDRYDSKGAIFHCCVSCFDNARIYTTLILRQIWKQLTTSMSNISFSTKNVFVFRLMYGKKEKIFAGFWYFRFK